MHNCLNSYLLFLVFLHGHHAFQISPGAQLDKIHEITTNEAAAACVENQYELVPIPIPTSNYKSEEQKAELAANLIQDTKGIGNYELIHSSLKHLLKDTTLVDEARIVSFEPFWCTFGTKENFNNTKSDFFDNVVIGNLTSNKLVENEAWMLTPIRTFINTNFMRTEEQDKKGYWTFPYYSCPKKSWTISYVTTIFSTNKQLLGFLSFDVDVSRLDINQCDSDLSVSASQLQTFKGTHKCHSETSQCIFEQGHGWTRGGYKCTCKKGFYSKTDNLSFSGSLVEVAYEAKERQNDTAYNQLYVCGKCQAGCETCIDDTPCLASYNWTFRYMILTFSLVCTLATFILMVLVYTYRKLKVFRLGSPTFLCITLVGCAIMYLEMVAIFPELDVYSCIATKWSRNMGFLLTYSSLLLKTWRVNLTFRVKSAHKLKLTDKQLLQWLFPILLVMMVYLTAWTLSDPPHAIYVNDSHGLKFKICRYDWWDHGLAIGNFLFLIWGIKVCFSVRKARTHFNEAKWITWSIYNIAIVNIIMVAIHLILFPNAGPDMKYFLGFLRTQFSTTITILLVFGPKFFRLARGTANELDDRIRARGNAASMIEVPLERNATQKDVYVENEELKEEIQKLAGQIQYLKIVGMLMENRHIKPKKDGYFSKENCSKHFQHFLIRNGTVINCSGHPSESKNKKQQVENHSKNGKVPSPICGQTVILAEKYEENTYTLIEPSTDQQNISPVKNGKKQPKDIETNLTSKQCGISCESKNFRELSPTAEPFIPEKVK